jgi:hypothetical protein
MSDKMENLNSALVYTGKAMQQIDNAAYALLIKSTPTSDEFKTLEEVYRALQLAEQRILELKV